MPWKGEKDPYKIWLSEIILQQTRVEQGLGYYQRFLLQFPDIQKLANAKEEKVYKLWEGLGYYTRCKNLIETARFIGKKRNGIFPNTYPEILALKGVGSYTAAAIASFAYNLPYAVVDGNVFRVLARVFGITIPIDSSNGKIFFSELAFSLLDKKKPGIYNQSIMDFGAVVCKPVNPQCNTCPLKSICRAYKDSLQDQLPVKEKKIHIKKRWFNYFILEYGGKKLIRKRTSNDIWRNLHEFILIETNSELSLKKILKKFELEFRVRGSMLDIKSVSENFSQNLSHQKIIGRFIELRLKKPVTLKGYKTVSPKEIRRYAFPGIINSYLITNP